MSDETQAEQQVGAGTPEQSAETPTDGSINTEKRQPESIPYARFQEIVAERNQLRERLASLEKPTPEKPAVAAAPATVPAVQSEAVTAEIARLKAEVESLSGVQTALKGQLGKRLERVPKHIRDLLEPMEPIKAMAWLDENDEHLMPRAAPETDAGKRGDRKGDAFVGSEEHVQEVKQRFGMRRG